MQIFCNLKFNTYSFSSLNKDLSFKDILFTIINKKQKQRPGYFCHLYLKKDMIIQHFHYSVS